MEIRSNTVHAFVEAFNVALTSLIETGMDPLQAWLIAKEQFGLIGEGGAGDEQRGAATAVNDQEAL